MSINLKLGVTFRCSYIPGRGPFLAPHPPKRGICGSMLRGGERGSANSKDMDLGKIHMLLAPQHRRVLKDGMPFMAPTVQKMGKQAGVSEFAENMKRCCERTAATLRSDFQNLLGILTQKHRREHNR